MRVISFATTLFSSIVAFPYFFFFFYCSGHHRDLHSFPTRRSSDLVVRVAVPDRAISRGIVDGDAHTDEPDTEHHEKLDRKSTRLNSSHRCISYAVFCLKKKKKNTKKSKLSKIRIISNMIQNYNMQQ